MLLVTLLLVTYPQTPEVGAPTDPVEKRLAAGEAALASLDYDVAADELTAAAADPSASEEQKLRANLLAGVVNVIVGRDSVARLNFRYVLLRNPETKLAPDTPQKVASYFELVRQEIEAEKASAPTGPAPVPPPPPPPEKQPSILPWAVAGGGALLLVGGGGLALASEAILEEPSLDAAEKSGWLLAGRTGIAVGVAGALVAGGGALLGALE